MTRYRRAGLLGPWTATALAACSVGNPYYRPAVPLPAGWVEARRDPSVAEPVWPSPEWWRSFGSSELDDLIASAQAGNDDLAAAVARVREADAEVRIAGAALLPTVDVSADATRERGGLTLGQRTVNIFNPQLTASYELDFWGRIRSLRDAARAQADASRFDRETVGLTVVKSVAETYFQALEFRDRLRVARENLENGRRILAGLRLEASAGTITALDVAQQATAVALLEAALPPLEQQRRQSVYALAVLLGRAPDGVDVSSGSLDQLADPIVVEGLPSQLLTRRPDVAEAEAELIAAHADLGAARAALFPSIALTASGGYESTMLETLISPASRLAALSAGLTQPIFHGGALRGQVGYDEARNAELLSVYHKTVLTALGNVESALVAARQTADQEQLQRAAAAAAETAFDYSQAQMAAGTVNILTVLNTEAALFSARDVLLQVRYAHLQALIDLYTALGGGWQRG